MKRPDENIPMPPLLRLILFVGRPLGVAFVPPHHMQVIYHMGKYAGCKGPGLIYHSRLTETMRLSSGAVPCNRLATSSFHLIQSWRCAASCLPPSTPQRNQV